MVNTVVLAAALFLALVSCVSVGSGSGGKPHVARSTAAEGDAAVNEPDPYPPQVRICIDSYKHVKPEPKAIMGAVERGGGCAIWIAFESQRDMDEFVRWRQQQNLPTHAIGYTDASGTRHSIPLELEVGGPILEEKVIDPKAQPPPSRASGPAPIAGTDLVMTGTISEIAIENEETAYPGRPWLVTVKVAKVSTGQFTGPLFRFRVHSPARSGLEVGKSHRIRAKASDNGYEVDELQWLR